MDGRIFCVVCFLYLVHGHGPHHPRSSSSVDHHHHHRATDSNVKLIQNDQLLRDKQHIKEDLQEIVDGSVTDKMSPEELEFYYFKVHDADNNTKLDGLEILHAVQHTTHDEKGTEEPENFDNIVELIDGVLLEDDIDNDGYLSYAEYVTGREREESHRHSNRHNRL